MSLTLVLGPMFAGKTSYIIDSIEVAKGSGQAFIAVNHASDTRYGVSSIISHNKVHVPALSLSRLDELYKQVENFKDIKYVYVDEAHFFPDLFNQVQKLLRENKHIILCGLDGDYNMEPFPDETGKTILDLVSYADTVYKLTSKCYICQGTAAFTKRLINHSGQIVIGGAETYAPVCRLHHQL